MGVLEGGPQRWSRRYKLSDAPALYEAAKESSSDVYQWLPWCHPEYKIEESEEWLTDQVRRRQEGTEFEFAILSSDGAYLGGCGLNQIDRKQKAANLGYWVRSSTMGQGIAVKAARTQRRRERGVGVVFTDGWGRSAGEAFRRLVLRAR